MRMFRIAVAAALIAGIVLGVSGCSKNDVAARVNGEVIEKSEIDSQIEMLKKRSPQMFEGEAGESLLLEYKQRTLDNLINDVLARQAAEERGINVSDKDVQAKIDELKAQFPDAAWFEQALEQSGQTLEELKSEVRRQLVLERLLAELVKDSKITEDEIKKYYESNKARFVDQAAVRASHILFDQADKSTAESVLAEIRKGADFAALAKKYSKDVATAASGGDLGWPTTPYVPEFQTALDALKLGEVSGLVKTQYGWHIIKVTDKRAERQRPLDEVRDEIEELISQQRKADAYRKFLDDLRKSAEIEYLIPELSPPQKDAVPSGGGSK